MCTPAEADVHFFGVLMAERLSDVLNIPTGALDAIGVFNSFVDIDSSLHIDPHLLRHSSHKEMQAADATLKQYFKDLAKILSHVETPTDDDPFFTEAVRRLIFKEDRVAALGYGQGTSAGTGISPTLARAIPKQSNSERCERHTPQPFEQANESQSCAWWMHAGRNRRVGSRSRRNKALSAKSHLGGLNWPSAERWSRTFRYLAVRSMGWTLTTHLSSAAR